MKRRFKLISTFFFVFFLAQSFAYAEDIRMKRLKQDFENGKVPLQHELKIDQQRRCYQYVSDSLHNGGKFVLYTFKKHVRLHHYVAEASIQGFIQDNRLYSYSEKDGLIHKGSRPSEIRVSSQGDLIIKIEISEYRAYRICPRDETISK